MGVVAFEGMEDEAVSSQQSSICDWIWQNRSSRKSCWWKRVKVAIRKTFLGCCRHSWKAREGLPWWTVIEVFTELIWLSLICQWKSIRENDGGVVGVADQTVIWGLPIYEAHDLLCCRVLPFHPAILVLT